MKKITINCAFGSEKRPVDLFVGKPKKGNHPLQYQAHWLATELGGTIPGDDMSTVTKLFKLAEENGVSFEDLCANYFEKGHSMENVETLFKTKRR